MTLVEGMVTSVWLGVSVPSALRNMYRRREVALVNDSGVCSKHSCRGSCGVKRTQRRKLCMEGE